MPIEPPGVARDIRLEMKMRVYESLFRFLFVCLATTAPNLRRSLLDKLEKLRRDARKGIPAALEGGRVDQVAVHQYRTSLDEVLDFIEDGFKRR